MKRAFFPLSMLLLAAVPCAGQTAPARLTSFYTHEGSEKLYRAAKYTEAESMCKQAVAEIEKARGSKAWELAEPLNDLATIYMRQARFAEAKQVIDRAGGVLDKTKADQVPMYARL